MSKIPTINVLSHMSRPNCFYCKSSPMHFYSIYIPINDKQIKWQFPIKPAPLNLKVFNGYYALTICTICNHILGD